MIVANIDDTNEPDIQNLYKKSIILERGGRKIGIIGVILRETAEIAKTGKLKFTNEIDAIRSESENLRQRGVNIIIVLSHCGLDRDREIAFEMGDHVDVIVGGHSHTFLCTTKDDEKCPGDDIPAGPYPIVITPRTSGTDRKVVLIVHASAFTKYVGNLIVSFDAAGHVQNFDGNPIFLSNAIKKNVEMETELAVWRREVKREGQRIVGYTNVDLMHRECRHGECKLGSFATDAFVHETQLELPNYAGYAAIIQSAGMRNSFQRGAITYADIVSFMPFEDTLDIVELSGDALRQVFEHSVSKSFVDNEFIGIHMLQISGLNVIFNTTRPVGQRVLSLNIKVNNLEYERVQNNKFYTVILPAFLANGSDGFSMIKLKRKNHRIGLLDVDIMEKYIRRKSPFTVDVTSNRRIVMLT
jgi:5'-nucleotidase